MASKLFLTLIKKVPLTHNVTSFVFERPKDFDFSPGQYVRIFDPIVGEGIFRDFTISSSPFEKQTIMLTIKHGITDYKKRLFVMPIGSKFSVEAPMGRFYLQEGEIRPQVFLAGGVGIAPFYSMVTYVTHRKSDVPVTLIASYATPEDILFASELDDLEKENKYLQVVHTISQPEKSKIAWNGHSGRINKSLLQQYIADISLPQFLISGSPSFVSDMEDLLMQMHVELNQVRTEVFLGF